ncbi:MAG: hypothetical protein WBD20_03505 [Pirellulaceae bacterium]
MWVRVFLSVLLLSGAAHGQIDDSISLQLTPLRDSFLETTFGHDWAKMRTTAVYRAAYSYGLDLPNDLHGSLIVRQRGSSWFSLFHNTIVCDPATQYVVQRAHKRISNYDSSDKAEVTDQYLVEAFKCLGGQLKRPDQHYSTYSLNNYKRRVIEKTFEIGEVRSPEGNEHPPWPFDDRHLTTTIQEYSLNRKLFDEVEFKRSVQWTIRVEMDSDGAYSLQVPELGIRYATKLPPVSVAATALDWHPENVRLTAGHGCSLFGLGAFEKVIRKVLGPPTRVAISGDSVLFFYPADLDIRLRQGRVSSISVADGFTGSTSKGIRLGDQRKKVVDAYGEPAEETSGFLKYPGLQVDLKKERVIRLTVLAID